MVVSTLKLKDVELYETLHTLEYVFGCRSYTLSPEHLRVMTLSVHRAGFGKPTNNILSLSYTFTIRLGMYLP